MDLHTYVTNGLALANGTILMGLINHLVAKQVIMPDEIRDIMNEAIKGVSSGDSGGSVASTEAGTIIKKMRDSI